MSLPWRRRHRDQQAQQYPDGQQPLRGPDRAYYQRLAGDFSKVSSNGTLTLTATHLIFASRIGTSLTLPLADVQQVRDQEIRRFHLFGHDSQLVIQTQPGQIGFLLKDPAGWAAAIGSQLSAAGLR
jgi:hypothetical protein